MLLPPLGATAARDLQGVDIWAGLMDAIRRGDDAHRRTDDLADLVLA